MSVEDKSRVDEVLKALEELESMYVVVGVLSSADGQLQMIANVHEFGCDIPVTDKMRNFFFAKFNVHLRKDTKVIRIPERSFIRSSFDKYESKLLEKGDLLTEVVDGNISAREFYEFLGQTCVQIIQDFIVNEVNSPANSALTIENKKSSNPLVQTGRLVNSIAYEIKYR